MAHQTKVASYYQLNRDSNGFTKDGKKLLRTSVFHVDRIKKINKDWKGCGKFFEVDEDATKEYHAECKVRNEKLADKYAAEKQLSNTLLDLAKGSTPEPAKPEDQTDHQEVEANRLKEAQDNKKEELSIVHEAWGKSMADLDKSHTELAETNKLADADPEDKKLKEKAAVLPSQ